MKRLISIMLLTLAFGLVYAFSPRFSTPPTTNASGSAPVTVVNTPLPTTVTNTPSVTISGMPNVNAHIANTPTNAIPVVQAPIGTNIYSNECIGTSQGSAGCVFPEVPTGMVLYVESASIQTFSTTGADPSVAGITEGLVAPPHFIPMIAQQPSSAGDSYVGQMVGTAHLPAGTPGCEVFLGGAGGTVTLTCTLSGYLVPAS